MKIKTRNKQAMGMLPVSSCCAERMSNPHELMKRICRASNAMGCGENVPHGMCRVGEPNVTHARAVHGPSFKNKIKQKQSKAKNNTSG